MGFTTGNVYQGGTTVSAGTLIVTTANALPDNTALTVAAGGTMIYDPASTQAGPVGDGPGGNDPSDQGPMVTAIQCVGSSLVDANTVQFSVAFSEAVTGVTPAEFVARWRRTGRNRGLGSGAGARYT